MTCVENVLFGVSVRNELVLVIGVPAGPTAVAMTVKRCETSSAQVLRHTVPASLSFPLTGSPPVSTVTFVILPPTALTVIPRFGTSSIPLPVGVVDKRTPSPAPPPPRPAALLRGSRAPFEQPAASR